MNLSVNRLCKTENSGGAGFKPEDILMINKSFRQILMMSESEEGEALGPAVSKNFVKKCLLPMN